MTEYANEPIPGLPGLLPPGERIVWQGSPDWRALARTAFHTRLIAGYFALLVAWAFASAMIGGIAGPGDLIGVAMTALAGIAGVALLNLFAWSSASTTIYTLTDRRIVLRIGIALPKCMNLPLGLIAAADLSLRADGTGDVPLQLTGVPQLGYLALWPHARPWKLIAPQPMLRSIPDAENIAALIARTCLAANPDGKVVAIESRAPVAQGYGEAAAA